MKNIQAVVFTSSLLACVATSTATSAAVVTFEDNPLAADSFFNPQANTTFTDGGVTFNHTWNDTFNCCWGNFTYSSKTDTTTPGFLNDRSAITGDGAGAGQDQYGIVFGNASFSFDQASIVQSLDYTNTTYAYLAVKDGNDGNDPAFVKGPFGAGDFFTVTVSDIDNASNSIDIALAVGSSVVDAWLTADLTSLGVVNGLRFSFDSSDPSSFGGINTPSYLAVDNIQYQAVPVPAAFWLFASGLSALLATRRVA